MSNLTSSIVLFIFGLTASTALYFLVAKWSKFLVSTPGKVFKGILVVLAIILLGGFFTGAYFNFDNYYRNDRPRLETELDGFQIGWSKDELYFRKGKPEKEEVDAEGKSEDLTYANHTYIKIESGKISRVMYVCQDSDYYKGIGNLHCHDSIDEVLEKYGDTDNIATSKDKLMRIYNYPQYNVAVGLEEGKIKILSVFQPKFFPKGMEFAE